ncbi:MAG: hypothetical protein AAGI28_08460 [Pseudomonadota bacterium]
MRVLLRDAAITGLVCAPIIAVIAGLIAIIEDDGNSYFFAGGLPSPQLISVCITAFIATWLAAFVGTILLGMAMHNRSDW